MFEDQIRRLGLIRDGEPIVTPTSRLLPVRWKNTSAMLKVVTLPEEVIGGALLGWWNGRGAARILVREGSAIVLERAENRIRLADLARTGRDDEATAIICGVAAELHTARPQPPPPLVPLSHWFEELEPAGATHGGLLAVAERTAAALLTDQRDIWVLHGDIHHGNILDFGPRGWLAIDPKGLVGERGFDYANLFCNPDLADPTIPVAIDPHCFERRVAMVSELAGLSRQRLVQWILAWSGLSAAWLIADNVSPTTSLRIAELASAELHR